MSFGGSTSGTSEREKTDINTKENKTGTKTSQLQLDDDAINKMIEDALGSADGLSAIFGGEQSTGLYNSTVANQAAGDLTAKLIGELAKITGKTVETEDTDLTTKSHSYTRGDSFTLGTSGSFSLGG